MRYRELTEAYLPDQDEFHRADITTGRKTRLTLKHLNKLRKVREIRRQDQQENADFVAKMYAQPPMA
jgi:hypothetical protein